VSSMQFDAPGRGFSFQRDEPLDMRMDQSGGDTAAALVARSTELESKIIKLEKDDEKLRRQLAEAEARTQAQKRAQDDEPTSTGQPLPMAFTEHLSVLEESIDSLRANMRAASDETATMEQSESVVAVSSAVSQAAEHVERARDSLRALTKIVGALS